MKTLTETDNWLVCGNMRTGSKLVVDCIISYYKQYGFNLEYKDPNYKFQTINALEIIHSHGEDDFKLINNNTIPVVCIRNPLNSTLSWCIQPHLHNYHFYSELNRNIPITPFYLDPSVFLKNYEVAIFKRIKMLKNIPDNGIIINYDSHKGNLYKICDSLKFYKPSISGFALPLQNPGSYEDWISNWVEIESLIDKITA